MDEGRRFDCLGSDELLDKVRTELILEFLELHFNKRRLYSYSQALKKRKVVETRVEKFVTPLNQSKVEKFEPYPVSSAPVLQKKKPIFNEEKRKNGVTTLKRLPVCNFKNFNGCFIKNIIWNITTHLHNLSNGQTSSGYLASKADQFYKTSGCDSCAAFTNLGYGCYDG